jgi:hypothetical protein
LQNLSKQEAMGAFSPLLAQKWVQTDQNKKKETNKEVARHGPGRLPICTLPNPSPS